MDLVLKPVDELPETPRARGVNRSAARKIWDALIEHNGGPLLALRGPRRQLYSVRSYLKELGSIDAVVKEADEGGADVFELYVRSEPF